MSDLTGDPADGGPARATALLSRYRGLLTTWGCSCRQDVRPALAVDVPLAALLLLYVVFWGPRITRATENPQYLAAFINDEPLITQQLVGMTLPPLGNPGNLMETPERRPPEWGSFVYPGVLYYGGTYLDAAFLLFAPLKVLGAADFPAAPVILRLVSLLAGLLAATVLYNLGREVGGRATGFGAVLLLLLDPSFDYYTSIIHPDGTMLALGLLALWVAIRHARRGDGNSLVTLGILIGLTHGAKAGGPWLLPLGLLAVLWGLWNVDLPRAQRLRLFLERGAALGLTALAAFACSTPYAFLHKLYFRAMKEAWWFNNHGPFSAVNYATWFRALWDYAGPVFLGLVLAALGAALWRSLKKDRPVPLALTAVLCLSVVAWYTTTVRVWVLVPYLLPALALAGLLAAYAATRPLLLLHRQGAWGRRGAAALAGALVLVVLHARLGPHLEMLMVGYCLEHTTVVEVGRWAERHLPHDSKILYDDIAYFDPGVFPNAACHRGLLTYADLEKKRPDYFVLSGSIYHSKLYVDLRNTQRYTRGQEGRESVLLYQDMIDRGGNSEAELVATFADKSPPQSHSLGTVLSLARLALGLDRYTIGQEIRLYRYRPAPPAAQTASAPQGRSGVEQVASSRPAHAPQGDGPRNQESGGQK